MNDLEEIDITPIEHGAFAHHGTKRNEPQFDQRAVGFSEDGLVAIRKSIFQQQAGRKEADNEEGKRRYHQEMLPGYPAEANKETTQEGAGKSGQTPQTMIGSHDGSAVKRFGTDGLGIDGNIEPITPHAQTKTTNY